MTEQDYQDADEARIELFEYLRTSEPGLHQLEAYRTYTSIMDDRLGVNNYGDSIECLGRELGLEKAANYKLWVPLNPVRNLDNLLDELGLSWIVPKHESKDQNMNKTGHTRQKREPNQSEHIPADAERHPIFDDERMKNIDTSAAERILNEVIDNKQDTTWDDIAGLENVKQAINEIVVWPMQNPELFQGLLAPAKGVLLFGPPGTGKTLIGKCIACESKATFFSISASSLTSKWIGEGEKMVRALFTVARCMQPSVVFIDEIDSLLTQRVDGEHDSTRKMKTEFLVQFDGVATSADDRLLIVGATNRPHELDDAARRRFTKRLYVPLPDEKARRQLVESLMAKAHGRALTDECLDSIVEKTAGYSGADLKTLCQEAALTSVRAVIRAGGGAKNVGKEDLPAINFSDFNTTLGRVKSSVGESDLKAYEDWNSLYGYIMYTQPI